jgi:hypothetical protein
MSFQKNGQKDMESDGMVLVSFMEVSVTPRFDQWDIGFILNMNLGF